ncbi:uncharacterized protein EI97DRAFT_501232, partial [Westerdykella ornata]
MQEEHPHPLLAQVPLTVSPFLNLPTATPLPYTYKQLPSTLPPSILSSPPTAASTMDTNPSQTPSQNEPHQPAYVLSSTGQTAASPDAILSSCHALQQHLVQLEAEARATLQRWEERRRAEDLAEKRRVAPGWLDGDVKLLVPENVGGAGEGARLQERRTGEGEHHARTSAERSVGVKAVVERRDGVPDPREGEELDRAFGGLDIG